MKPGSFLDCSACVTGVFGTEIAIDFSVTEVPNIGLSPGLLPLLVYVKISLMFRPTIVSRKM